mmetsp:Transcript_4861/g.13036  ORF Transcript_4861/g.13036 Transcript_4861/m.13036 type:complete len:328 (-) Transcript_4861:117-1100(-)
MTTAVMGQQELLAGTVEKETLLIARPEALGHFEQQQAQQQAQQQRAAHAVQTPNAASANNSNSNSKQGFFSKVFCFGADNSTATAAPSSGSARAAAPANLELEVQRKKFEWNELTEHTLLVCIDHLFKYGIREQRLFAVSADQDDVDALRVQLGMPLPENVDLHVAAATIKDRMRHAKEPFMPIAALKPWLEKKRSAAAETEHMSPPHSGRSSSFSDDQCAALASGSFEDSVIKQTLEIMRNEVSPKRAYLCARFLLLLGYIASGIETTQMNSHNLALCITPSLLQWDNNAKQALLILSRMTAFVIQLIDDAQLYSEKVRRYCDELH